MHCFRLRHPLPILLACLALCLAGCSDHPDSGGTVDPSERAVPMPSSGSAAPTNLLAPSDVPTDTSSDPVAHGDTLASGGHSLGDSDPIASDDPIGASRDISSENDPMSGRPSGKRGIGWYWLRGTVQNGSVAVALNGVPCGDYTDFTDRELTRYVMPGMNRIAFTSEPASATRPLKAQLVLYMRAASADAHQTVPAATYMQSSEASLAATFPGETRDPLSHIPGGPTPAPFPRVAAPQTRTMTFFAK